MANSNTVVLVIDDEPILRIAMMDLVEDAGFEVAGAANAKDAIRVLESRADVGLIVSDIHMPPGIDGMALAAIVRDRWPPIEIILVSGRLRANEVRMPEGSVFFSKPYRPADIVATISRMAATQVPPIRFSSFSTEPPMSPSKIADMRSTLRRSFRTSSEQLSNALPISRPRPKHTGSKPNAQSNGCTKSTLRSRIAFQGRTRAEARGGIDRPGQWRHGQRKLEYPNEAT